MAYVVRRTGGRWEIRESVATDRGPRARSLVVFRVLDGTTLDRAAAAATRPFDRTGVLASARRAGARVAGGVADASARRLLAQMARGSSPSPALARLLRENLADRPSTPGVEMDLVWLDASDEARGRTLRDLLDLGDRLPARRRGPLRYPPLTRPAGG